MDNLLVFTVVLGFLILIQLNYDTIRKAYFSPLSKVPGPWYAHLSNLRLKFAVITGNRPHYLHALHKQYGSIVRVSPTEISTCDVEAYKTIYNARTGFGKDQWYNKITFQDRPVVFDMPIKEHAVRRRLLARGFQKTFLRSEWEGRIREMMQLCVRQIKAEAEKNDGVVDLYKWWTFLTADVAGLVMFGESFGMLESGEKNEFIRNLTQRMTGEGIAVELPFVRKLDPYIPSEAFHDLFRGKGLIEKYATRAISNMANGTTQNVFTKIAREAEKGDPTLTDEDVANEATNLTIAGADTTGITLTYLVWAVLKQPPAVQMALEAEVAAVPQADLRDEVLEKLPILNAIITETLRLYNPAPGPLFRSAPEGGTTLCGYEIPGGTTVSAQAWSLHRLREIWGPDSDEFDYTRWLPENGKDRVSEQAKSVFAAWGGQPRTCLGIHMANMEMRLAIAMFFRECKGAKLAPTMSDKDMEIENYFLSMPKGHKCLITV